MLDQRVPLTEGYEFLQDMLAQPRLASVPVAVISATSRELEESSALGVVMYFPQPMKMGALLDLAARYTAAHA